jgi:hypothetical protein
MKRLASSTLALPGRLQAPWSRRAKLGAGAIVLAAAGLVIGLLVFRHAQSAGESEPLHGKAASVAARELRTARARALAVARAMRAKPPRQELVRVRIAQAPHAAALFAVHSWYVPPPPPPAATTAPSAASLAPQAPVAPPLPFQYMGSYKPDGAAPVFFLTRGDRVYDVHVGDTLENTYSIDGFNGTQLLLTYKPLNIKQELSAGSPP